MLSRLLNDSATDFESVRISALWTLLFNTYFIASIIAWASAEKMVACSESLIFLS